MNQKGFNGMTLLDCAKSGAEHFINLRLRDPNSRGDRFLLVTCEEGVGAVKAGWRDSLQTLLAELKTLQAYDLGDLGASIKRSFDLLNLGRLTCDNYGAGRAPWLAEPTYIFVFTDGAPIVDISKGVQNNLTIPSNPPSPGQDLCKDIFKWDQRLFTFVLRVSPHAPPLNNQKPPNATGGAIAALGPLSEATGGKLHIIMSMKHLLSTLESISQRVPAVGVTANFEPLPLSQERLLPISVPAAPSAMRKLIYARPGPASNWPLPDEMTLASFVPGGSGSSGSSTVFRFGQPTIRFNPTPVLVPHHPGDFAVDRYVIEQCSMSEWMISTCNALAQSENGHIFMAQMTGVSTAVNKEHLCFEVCIQPAGMSSQGDTSPPSSFFGFLKPHFESNAIHLWVLPYNFPFLFQLLNAWGMSGTPKWRDDFARYIKSLPGYYFSYLQHALSRWKPPPVTGISFSQPPHTVQSLLAEMAPLQAQSLSVTLSSYIKQTLRSLKEESDKLDASLVAYREAQSLKAAARGLSRPKVGSGISQFHQSLLSSTPSTPGGPDSQRSLVDFRGLETEQGLPYKPKNGTMPSSSSSKPQSGNGTPQVSSLAATPTAGRTPGLSSISKVAFTRVDLYSIHPADLMAYLERVASLPPVDPFASTAPPALTDGPTQNDADKMGVDLSVHVTDSNITGESAVVPRMVKPSANSIPLRFRVPIAEMGNYQELLAKQKNLRPVDEESVPQRSYFGNPYARRGKGTPSGGVLVDEADVSAGEAAALRSTAVSSPSGTGKRKGAPAGSASERDMKLRQKLPKVASSVSSSHPQEKAASAVPLATATVGTPTAVVPPAAAVDVAVKVQPPLSSTSITPAAPLATAKPVKPPLLQKAPKVPKPAVPVPTTPVPTIVGASAPAAVPQVIAPVVLGGTSSSSVKGLEMLQIRQHNNSIKFSIIELIRQPASVPIEPLIAERLKGLRGDAGARRRIVKEIVVMALQYKRTLSIPEVT